MLIVVGPNESRIKHFMLQAPIAGDVFTVTSGRMDRVRGVQAHAVIFTDSDLMLMPHAGFYLASVFSNYFDQTEAQKFRKVIYEHTMGGKRAATAFLQRLVKESKAK